MKSVLRTDEILLCRMQYAPRMKSLRRCVDGFPFTRALRGFHLPATAGDFTVHLHDFTFLVLHPACKAAFRNIRPADG